MSDNLDRHRAALDDYANGLPIKAAVKARGLSWASFYRVVRQNPELFELFNDAKGSRALSFGDEILTVSDDVSDPRRARVKLESLKFLAERLNPDVFGQRTEIKLDQRVSVAVALVEARQRLQRDLAPPIELQAIDVTAQSEARTPDCESGDADDVDIFA